MTEEDFRKSGFRSRDLVVILAGPTRLIAGRITPLPSAALRPGSIGLESASVHSLDCGGGARVRVRRLENVDVTVIAARSIQLVLERGVGFRMQTPHTYLDGFTDGRWALLKRAVGYTARGYHLRERDLLAVSFEGVSHRFRVAKTLPAWVPPSSATYSGGNDSPEIDMVDETARGLVAPFTKLSVSRPDSLSAPSAVKNAVSSRDSITNVTQSSSKQQLLSPVQDEHHQRTPSDNIQSTAPLLSPTVPSEPRENTNNNGTSMLERLQAFYREHNPEKLDNVPGILEKYTGREDALFAKLERIYGPGSLRAATSGGDNGRSQWTTSPPILEPESPSPAAKALHLRSMGEATATPSKGWPPTADHRSVATPISSDLNSAGVRLWGSNEALWLITKDTAIEITTADAPSTLEKTSTLFRTPEKHTGKRFFGESVAPTGVMEVGGAQVNDKKEQWSSVGGLSAQIEQLKEAIELPLKSPEVLRRYGVRPPRGVLLHGPPGTGKTTLARAAAVACGCHVIVVNGSEMMSRWAICRRLLYAAEFTTCGATGVPKPVSFPITNTRI